MEPEYRTSRISSGDPLPLAKLDFLNVSKPLQTMGVAEGQVFKYRSLYGSFHTQTITLPKLHEKFGVLYELEICQ